MGMGVQEVAVVLWGLAHAGARCAWVEPADAAKRKEAASKKVGAHKGGHSARVEPAAKHEEIVNIKGGAFEGRHSAQMEPAGAAELKGTASKKVGVLEGGRSARVEPAVVASQERGQQQQVHPLQQGGHQGAGTQQDAREGVDMHQWLPAKEGGTRGSENCEQPRSGLDAWAYGGKRVVGGSRGAKKRGRIESWELSPDQCHVNVMPAIAMPAMPNC
eukprot:scaffold201577_cov19-Tisochrysis_lutea.AAC.1